MEENLKQILRELFPIKLAELLITNISNDLLSSKDKFDLTTRVAKENYKSNIIGGLFVWKHSQQVEDFWSKLYNLYEEYEEPTEEQVNQIFKEFNIE